MMKLGRSRSSTIIKSGPKITKCQQSNNNMTTGQCKKHPKHRQSPGVCSLCLSDKLSRVSTAVSAARTRARARTYYSSSSSLSSSDDDSSYASSPDASPPRAAHHRRIVSDIRPDPLALHMSIKSQRRSTAIFVDEKKMNDNNNNNNVISGFWSKLLGPRFGNKQRRSHGNDHHHLNKMVSRSQPLASTSSLAVY